MTGAIAPEAADSPLMPSTHSMSWLSLRFGIVWATATLFVVLALVSDPFLSSRNLVNIVQQNAPLGIVAVCVTPALISGAIDLSLATVYAAGGIVAISVANATGILVIGALAGIACGVVIGLCNGLLATFLRINSLIATLALGIVVSGISYLATGGFLVEASSRRSDDFGGEHSLGLGAGVIVFATIAALGQFLLSHSTAGRRLFATGGNPEAARLSGIRVSGVRTTAFVCSAAGAALAGTIVATEVGQASPEADQSVLFSAFAAVVIGGTSIRGGEGAIWRTVVGVLLLALVNNGLNLLSVPPSYMQIVQGGIILLAVALDRGMGTTGVERG